MKAKILIVGGGAMGTCIALHAAQRCDPLREPVVLIEKDRLGAGSSGRTAAVVHQGYSNRMLAGMARDALKVYAGFERTTGRSVGYRRTGVLILAGPGQKDSVQKLEMDIEMQQSIGIDVTRLEPDAIRQLVPGIEISDETVGAFEPAGGFVNPIRAIESFATLARNRGAVTRIGVKDPTILVENGRAVGVETSEGTFYAPQIVLATGPWTPFILKDFGVELPLRVVRTLQHFVTIPTQEALGEIEEEELAPETTDDALAEIESRFEVDPLDRLPVPHPVIFDFEQRMQARCEPGENRTRVGRLDFTGLQDVEDPERLGSTESFPDWAREALVGRLPVYEHLQGLESEVANITLTPDEQPIVGPIEEVPGLYVVTGFNGNDFQLAPSIGEGVAQMLTNQPISAFDPDFFSLGRFQQTNS